MTFATLIAKIRTLRPDIEPWLIDRAERGDKAALRQVADQVCCGDLKTLSLGEVHEIGKWGIQDELSRCPDHPCR